ncbi:hypothetical protein A6M14_12925 [Acinetobacter sp. Ac_877]|uniref:hypothetical protein n=1 Tax=Acinetobacter portensis TaxID=1839785 RepID=UPI00128CB802|nr:hypothetical protein [Acinetobacter portensis]MPW42595.1 hypothetical protein [Acinetobacter portensis]
MAFDLVQYFNNQIKIQKTPFLNKYDCDLRDQYIQEVNTLVLGKLVTLWQDNGQQQFQEIHNLDPLYIQEIAHSLTTSIHNESKLAKTELEYSISEMVLLQLQELQQLEKTGNYGILGLKELIIGQVEHLSGQADDWVWSTNGLIELRGSKPINQEDISLDSTMKEFNQMVQHHSHADDVQVTTETVVPTWAKILEPIVAIIILWVLAQALCSVFA